jgi:hypothetical protein
MEWPDRFLNKKIHKNWPEVCACEDTESFCMHSGTSAIFICV